MTARREWGFCDTTFVRLAQPSSPFSFSLSLFLFLSLFFLLISLLFSPFLSSRSVATLFFPPPPLVSCRPLDWFHYQTRLLFCFSMFRFCMDGVRNRRCASTWTKTTTARRAREQEGHAQATRDELWTDLLILYYSGRNQRASGTEFSYDLLLGLAARPAVFCTWVEGTAFRGVSFRVVLSRAPFCSFSVLLAQASLIDILLRSDYGIHKHVSAVLSRDCGLLRCSSPVRATSFCRTSATPRAGAGKTGINCPQEPAADCKQRTNSVAKPAWNRQEARPSTTYPAGPVPSAFDLGGPVVRYFQSW